MPTKSNIYKKKIFVEKMKKTLGNITASSEAAGINRCTYYDWYEKDADFRAAIDAISESCIDFAESSLMQQIKDGNPTSTIFYLKTKGKKRGYVETAEITGKDGKDLIPAKLDVSKLTDEQLKAITEIRTTE